MHESAKNRDLYAIDPDSQQSLNWYAVRVKSQCEKLVAAAIRGKGYEEFLPLYRRRSRWSDRLKTIELPLFPGYVFCRLNSQFRLPILTIPGVSHFVGIGKAPEPIDSAEITAVQTAVRSGLSAEPSAYLEAGQHIRLDEGPLAGLEGILIEVRNQYRVVVSVTLLQRAIAVEIERHWVTPLSRPKAASCAAAFAV